MSRRVVLIALLLAGAFAAPARSQPVQLIPGTPALTFEKQAVFTIHGLVGINVLVAPKPGGLWSLQPVLSNELIQGTEKLTAIEQRLAGSATTAGVNGDVVASGGRPDGLLERNGVARPRSAHRADEHRRRHVGRAPLRPDLALRLLAGRQDAPRVRGPERAADGFGHDALHARLGAGHARRRRTASRSSCARSRPAAPNTDLVGTSAQVVSGGAAAIPPDGAVLVARGSAAPALRAEAPVGQAVRVRFALLPDWPSAGVTAGLGGGPLLVRNGKAVVKSGESIPIADLALREPRTAVGQRADGSIVLVSVDGGLPGSGLTNLELAQTLVRLGVVNGAALAGGPTSGMAFDGHLLSTPAGGREQPVADALLVEYAGVYASPPSAPAVSPNGDGVAETETFTYKVVRPSTVTSSFAARTARSA